MSHKLIITGELVGIVTDNKGNIVDKVNHNNILTHKAKTILSKNLIENIDTPTNSNKLVGLILTESRHDKIMSKTLNDLVVNSDFVKSPITLTSYTGSGALTYAARYSFTETNATAEDVTYQTFGLITGDNISNAVSQHLFSILNCNINIPNSGGSFSGDYIISIAIKRF